LKKNKGSMFLVIIIVSALLIGCSGAQPAARDAQPSQTTQPQAQTAPASTEAVEPEAEVPADIEKAIAEADAFFKDGDYADAQQQYRKAEIAIKAEDSLSSLKREELLSYVVAQKDYAADITATARIHFGNAMMLQYEKRFEDALEELELAIKAYPKYQDAIDALDSLAAMMGLS
jgi:tetratricopeptide (TPR) repeat protein